ncbi:MAG: tRNA lysidine(34) synthetase TilS [Gammaproteobacteria bacterium]
MKHGAFSPEWLEQRLATLLPGYPDVALCVALSGGLDSVSLLAALAAPETHKLKRSPGKRPPKEVMVKVGSSAGRVLATKRGRNSGPQFGSLRAVHVHHGLHPNADRWSAHCAKIAALLGVPLTVVRVKVARPRGASLEAAARDARYDALANALEPGEALLTAHHEDDQLETVFLQLMRGAGIPGLAAMPEVSPFGCRVEVEARGRRRGGAADPARSQSTNALVRPLLTRSRAELEAWANSQGLTWVDDDTNADESLDRNYLRRRVLPLIRERWPSAAASVARTARHAAEAKRLLDALALADFERAASGASLSVPRLHLLSPDRRRNAVRFWIARASVTLPDTRRLEEIIGPLLDARPDANPKVEWNGSAVQRHADLLTLQKRSEPSVRGRLGAAVPNAKPARRGSKAEGVKSGGEISGATPAPLEGTSWNWRAHPQIELSGTRGTLSLKPDRHGPIDLNTLPETLTIRPRAGGERLRPSRGRPTRTLKALFQEARVPLQEREDLPLIYASDQLIAAADRWLDTSILATDTTRHRARLRWQKPA